MIPARCLQLTVIVTVAAGALACSPAPASQKRVADSSSADSARPVVVAPPIQSSVLPRDWASYNRDVAGDRFSPLAQITRANVANLKSVCTYELPEVTSLQTGPLVIAGTMYFTTDTMSYAINARTCAQRWRHSRHSSKSSPLLVNRGFGYLDGRLFRGTYDGHILAMDTTDGRVIWDHVLGPHAPGMSVPMAPIAANGMVFVGNAGGDQVGVTGHVYALDARDGHQIWRFDVVPDTGSSRDTWPNRRLPLSGGAFWTSFTYDALQNVLYVPAGNPAPDFDTQLRTGDNLFTNSVIAIDAANGKMLAYNQLVERDSHDWDVDSPPTLITTRAGRVIVASANKDGQLAVLDRSRITRGSPVGGDMTSGFPVRFRVATTTRFNADAPLSRDSLTRFCPGISGGSEWNGAAYSPHSNLIYVGTVDRCASVQLKRDTLKIPSRGQTWLGNANPDPLGPSTSSSGWLSAIDAETGVVKWTFHAPQPILAGVTPTAGGIVFAADLGGNIYAFDADSGHVLWKTATGQSTGGGIVSYSAGGHQLVGVASGMKSPVWPGAAKHSGIRVYGLQ